MRTPNRVRRESKSKPNLLYQELNGERGSSGHLREVKKRWSGIAAK